jgi:hypothetical protein
MNDDQRLGFAAGMPRHSVTHMECNARPDAVLK